MKAPHQQPPRLELTPEEYEKVARAKERARSISITKEDYMLAELGVTFGWGAIHDYLDDFISHDKAMDLLEAARRIYKDRMFDQAIVGIAARSKTVNTFNKIMKPYENKGSIE